MIHSIPYLGEILASLAAVLWAIAVILFKKSGEHVHPIALNLFKTALAVILFIPTLYFFKQPFFRDAPLNEYVLLLVSGAIGIGIADTLFFKCLNMLGAGLTAIVECMYSPFVIGLSILWLGESLSLIQFLGAFLIIAAVFTTTSKDGRGTLSARNLFWGMFWGIAGLACIAVAIVSIKPLLDRSPILWVTQVRLIGGTLMLLLILLFDPRRKRIIRTLSSVHSWKYTLTGSIIGTYFGMLFWIGGMKFTQASTAAALNQTSNIFIFIFAAIFLKEAINKQRIIAIILGVVGAVLVIFG